MNEQKEPRKFPIVGIGASAGGIEALGGFFKGVPSNSGIAYVVVTHLSPDRESLLHEVIGRYTDLPVQVAVDRAVIEPDKVYVLPANAVLGIEGGRLQVHKLGPSRRERKPIDLFLSALARDRGEYAAGVILSGGDADGTLGIKAIKERGGLTLAQVADGSGPSHPSMPESAIASGMIDLPIVAEQMGPRLVEFAHGFAMLDHIADTNEEAGSWEAARHEIYSLLRHQIGHDFEGYKINTFMRRVQRRMQIKQIETVEAYVERLRQEAREVQALFRDLLISVTDFFRDTEAFEALREHVIPKLFEGRGANDSVRVWIPACATGEEVFSIAILLREHMSGLSTVPRVQIFATDIDEAALSAARTARYPAAMLENISEERRRRFFSVDGGTFQVNKEVRDLCIFSPHSVLRDPPFSRIDLVSCRNLLIYLGADLQNQIVAIFHYSLRPGGYLFLGLSENASQFSDMFTPVDKKSRIFRSRSDIPAMARVPMLVRVSTPQQRNEHRADTLAYTSGTGFRQLVDREILEQHAPPHVLVNSEGDVVYFSARIGKYLEPPQGTPNRQLLAMARRPLRLDLLAAFREAVAERRKIVRGGIVLETEQQQVQHLTITIQPLSSRVQDGSLFLVIFTAAGPQIPREVAFGTPEERADESAAQLERELRDTRERLEGMIEEYETAVEELKSSNEELVSVNEELQSTNEEMEASKEELQSLNEELNTVNVELTGKIDDLERAKNDLENLFVSTQVATVFLDENLIIRNFTPAASAIFTIRGGDAGRPLADFSSRLPLPHLQDDVRSVLQNGKPMERPVENVDGTLNYLSRLIPYHGTDAKVEGVVLTFVDVTSLTKAEGRQRVLVAELNHRVKNMLAVAIALTEQTRIDGKTPEQFKKSVVDRLRAMARSYGSLSRENWEGAPIQELVAQELEPFGRERFVFEGPDIHLKPRVALPIGMILHELTTNAAKYGALSVEGGSVKIRVETTEDQLMLEWREMGGPPVPGSPHDGFGMKLIKIEAGHNLSGNVELKFDRGGLVAVLHCKL